MADDEVTSVGIPTPANGDPTVEAETRPQDAPWGYKADGTPYKVDPARYAKRDAKRKPKPGSKPSKAKASPYAETVSDLLILVSGGLAIAGTRDPAFLADAIVFEEAAPSVGDAFGKLADQNENVARMLDKLSEVGPYGLVFAALAPIVTQCMANHGVIQPGFVGTVEPAALIEAKLGPMPNDDEERAA